MEEFGIQGLHLHFYALNASGISELVSTQEVGRLARLPQQGDHVRFESDGRPWAIVWREYCYFDAADVRFFLEPAEVPEPAKMGFR